MTNLNTTASHEPGTGCDRQGQRPVARILAVLERLVQAYRSRRESEHLASLSDYLLKDMGITRGDIDVVVRSDRHPWLTR